MYNCNNCLWVSRDLCKTCPKRERQENKEVKSNDKNYKKLG